MCRHLHSFVLELGLDRELWSVGLDESKPIAREKVFRTPRIVEGSIQSYQWLFEGRDRAVVYALVDSGATVSLFHISIAEDVGIDLEDAEPVYLAGIGGYIRAYIKKRVKISIEGLGSITIPIAFSEYIAADIAVLDHQGFFEASETTFGEWEKKLVIKPRTP